jgi:SAM-dependent methyltransferase
MLATVMHADTLVLDRWRWVRRRLPLTGPGGASLLDVGCGSGAFTMGAARRGYEAVGLSWDDRNQATAMRRASLLGLSNVSFPICDVRRLDERKELHGRFDIVLCLENIEHILDDRKLVRDMFHCLKPGGWLLLTTPNYFCRPMGGDLGPFRAVEDGGHVRRGYSPAMPQELCEEAGFRIEEIGYVSNYFSQRSTAMIRRINRALGIGLRWIVSLPLRVLPALLDGGLGRRLAPGYSTAMWLSSPGSRAIASPRRLLTAFCGPCEGGTSADAELAESRVRDCRADRADWRCTRLPGVRKQQRTSRRPEMVPQPVRMRHMRAAASLPDRIGRPDGGIL